MILSSVDENCSSMDEIVICQIFSCFSKFFGILAKIGNLCEQNVIDDSYIYGWTNLIHGWKCLPWMEVSSVNAIHGERTVINGWHPQMKMIDDRHRRSNNRGHGLFDIALFADPCIYLLMIKKIFDVIYDWSLVAAMPTIFAIVSAPLALRNLAMSLWFLSTAKSKGVT